jgi:hypothetical protein
MLSEGGSWTSPTYSDATGGNFDSLFGIAVKADSIVVLFNDTLRIVHVPFPEASGNTLPYEGRTDIVFFDNLRSLQNSNSHTIDDNKSDSYMARYEFNNADLNYAISVYE